MGYLLAGGSAIPLGMRFFLVFGGIVIYLALAVVWFLLA